MERALFNCLDSDCGPLTELYVFQLIFIEICNYPWIVSSEESLDYLMSRLWQKKPLINTSCSPKRRSSLIGIFQVRILTSTNCLYE